MTRSTLSSHLRTSPRLRSKLILVTALVLILACSVLGWLFIRQQVTSVTDGLIHSGTLLAQHLAATSRYAVLASDEAQLVRLVTNVLPAEDVAYVLVTATQGRFRVARGKGLWDRFLHNGDPVSSPFETLFDASKAMNPIMQSVMVHRIQVSGENVSVNPRNGLTFDSILTLMFGDDVSLFYDVQVPVLRGHPLPSHDTALQLLFDEGLLTSTEPQTSNSAPVGVVHIGLSTLSLQADLRQLIWQVVSLTALIMLLALVAITIITHRMTTPLRELTSAARQVAVGDFTATIQPSSRDEIGELTQVFTYMLKSIQQREDALTDLNRTLEERILARTDELQSANAKLQELDRRKSLFVSTASHEIRTPLTSMKVHLDNLHDGVDGPLTNSQTQVVGRIQVNLGRLQHLLEELLDLSRIELGQTTLDLASVDLSTAVMSTLDTLQSLAARKGIILHPQLPPGLPPVAADLLKIQQVFMNLLHNAVKFSHERGTVVIRAEQCRDGYMRVSVQDAGVGIAPDEIEKVFEPFYRSPQLPPHARGTGLGLPIAKHLVELHHGRLWVESRIGQGSCFSFTLPMWPLNSGSGEAPIDHAPHDIKQSS